jgi:hypothetical protein
LYLSTNRPEEAETVLNKVLEWLPGDAEVRTLMGVTLSVRDKAGAAESQWLQAISDDPGYALSRYYLGVSLSSRAPDKAKSYLQSFVRLAESQGLHPRQIEKAQQLLKKL